VINSTAGTVSTLTLNTTAGTVVYEGVIGASGPCPSAGGLSVVKEGGGAQIFKKGALWYWNTGLPGTNFINADISVNAGAIGFSGTDVLGPTNRITVSAGGALIATNKAVLAALMADPRVTLDPASGVGVYDGWDVTAADPTRPFYYSGTVTNSTDNTATFPNGLSFASGLIHINLEGAAGDATFGPVSAPLYLNGTTLKNFNTSPILAAARTITINAGGAAFTAGWVKNLTVLSKLTGAGAFNVNCDSGFVVLSNAGNDYAGDTTVATLWAGSSGTTGKLKLGASEVIPHGAGKGSLVLNAGATLDLNGFNETVNGLSSAAATALVTNSSLNAATLTVGANAATSSYAGRLGGAVSLVKTGAGTVTLAAYCGHTGTTVAEAGTLSLGAACTLTNSTVEVKGGATLAFADGDAFGGAGSATELLADAQARLAIPAGVEVTVFHFAIGGQFKKAGVWGPSGSGADFVNDALFATEGGTLRVLETGPQRGTFLRLK
jgi:autotransporter-associated beta strand protein